MSETQPRLRKALRQQYWEQSSSPWLKARIMAEVNTQQIQFKHWYRYARGIALVAVVLIGFQLLSTEDKAVTPPTVASKKLSLDINSLSITSLSTGSLKIPGISSLDGVPALGQVNAPNSSSYSKIDFCLYPRRGDRAC